MIAVFLTSAATLAAFFAARWLSARLGHPAWANPVLWASAAILAVLWLSETSLDTYAAWTEPLKVALELAIVALAFPLVTAMGTGGRRLGPAVIALAGGSAATMLSAIWLARLLGLPQPLVEALSVKSVSSGFAIALMERFGGPAPLAVGLVLATGMLGALILPPIFRLLGVTSDDEVGLATGQAAHIFGTDALMRSNRAAGAWSALGLALGGLMGTLLLPLFWPG